MGISSPARQSTTPKRGDRILNERILSYVDFPILDSHVPLQLAATLDRVDYADLIRTTFLTLRPPPQGESRL